jgi:hypothetical protein
VEFITAKKNGTSLPPRSTTSRIVRIIGMRLLGNVPDSIKFPFSNPGDDGARIGLMATVYRTNVFAKISRDQYIAAAAHNHNNLRKDLLDHISIVFCRIV